MPKLPQPVSRPQLPEKIFTAETQGAAIGRGMQEAAAGVANLGQTIQRNEERSDISKLNAAFATAQAELTVQWQETLRTADPNDPNTAQRFRDEVVAPRLQQLGDIANTRAGREYATRAGAGLNATLLTSTSAGQQQLREVAAVQNWQTTLNQFSDSLSADPQSFDGTMNFAELQLQGLIAAEGLSTAKAEVLRTKMNSTLAIATATGLINQNPPAGMAAVQGGQFSEFLTASQKAQLISYANSQQRAQEAAQEKARKKAAARRRTEYLGQAIDQNGEINAESLPSIIGAMINDPTLAEDPSALQSTANFLDNLVDESSGAAFRDDPQLVQSLMDRILLAPGDPNRPTENEIYDLYGNGLKRETADWMVKRLSGAGTPRTDAFNRLSNSSLRTANAFITGSGTLDFVDNPQDVLNAQSFEVWFRAESQRLFEEGMSPTEIFAPDGPVMSQLPQFKQKLTRENQRTLIKGGELGVITREVTDDPFDTGPKFGDEFNGKPLRDATPSDMDEWLRQQGGE